MTLIQDLPQAVSVSTNDLLILQQGGITKVVTAGSLVAIAPGLTSVAADIGAITTSPVSILGDVTNIRTSAASGTMRIKYIGTGGGSSGNIDGGNASSVYTTDQILDGGGA